MIKFLKSASVAALLCLSILSTHVTAFAEGSDTDMITANISVELHKEYKTQPTDDMSEDTIDTEETDTDEEKSCFPIIAVTAGGLIVLSCGYLLFCSVKKHKS